MSARSTTRTTNPNGAWTPPVAPHDRAEVLPQRATEATDPHEAETLRDEAVLLTLDLPEQVVSRCSGRGIDHDDLVQVGRLGLVKAAAGYRPGLSGCFAAYAMPTVSGEVKRHFRDCGWSVRPPRRLQKFGALMTAQEEQLTHRLHRFSTSDEVADALGLDRDEDARAKLCRSALAGLGRGTATDRADRQRSSHGGGETRATSNGPGQVLGRHG